MKKNILVLSSSELQNPMRGTPIRVCKCIEQIVYGGHAVTVSALSIDEKPESYTYIPTPKGSVWKRFSIYRTLIREKNIEWIFTPTSTDIKMAILLKIFCGVSIAIDIHGVSNEEAYYFGTSGYLKKVFRGFVFTLQLFFFDAIFVVSKKMGQYYCLHKARIHVLYGGVSLLDFPQCAIYKEKGESPFTVAYMGNARPYQGLSLYLEALSFLDVKDLRLLFIISGDTTEVELLLKKHSVFSQSIIHHDVPHDEVASLLSGVDALVIPRPSIPVTEYSYPSKLPECVATGIPVVATDVGPVSELFEDGVHCVITPSDDVRGFGEGIMRVYNAFREERTKMGEVGRTRVESKLQWDILGETIRAVFK